MKVIILMTSLLVALTGCQRLDRPDVDACAQKIWNSPEKRKGRPYKEIWVQCKKEIDGE